MKIDSINIKNYRCFENFDIKFDDKLTVIVGNNGSGKSTVLDAVSIAIGSFLLGIDGQVSSSIHADDVRHIAYQIGSTIELQPQFPASIQANGSLNNHNITWVRTLNKPDGRTTTVDSKQLTNISTEMQKRVRDGDSNLLLPIISYYGTGRLWAQKRQKRDIDYIEKSTRFSGYIDCLDVMSNEKLMLKWFEKMTMFELQKGESFPELSATKNALNKFYSRMTNHLNVEVIYNLASRELEVNFTNSNGERQKSPTKELSDGYRNTLSMIADIAYRMATLNPQLLEDVIEATPGVVLIDEVDLHLHPTWQQHILDDLMDIFPSVQFIVTTHAPSVINSIKKEHLVILEDFKAYYPQDATYGRDVNSILATIMGADTRPKAIKERFVEFYEKLHEGKLNDAGQILEKLETEIGSDDPEIAGAKVSLDLEDMED